MSISDIDYIQQFGEIFHGEIDNYCIEEYEDSLQRYLGTNRPYYIDFLQDFGEITFGEINNPFLQDFRDLLLQNEL